MSVSTFLNFSILLILFLFLTENSKAMTKEQLNEFLENLEKYLKGQDDNSIEKYETIMMVIIEEFNKNNNNKLFKDPQQISRDFNIYCSMRELEEFSIDEENIKVDCCEHSIFNKEDLIEFWINNKEDIGHCPNCNSKIPINERTSSPSNYSETSNTNEIINSFISEENQNNILSPNKQLFEKSSFHKGESSMGRRSMSTLVDISREEIIEQPSVIERSKSFGGLSRRFFATPSPGRLLKSPKKSLQSAVNNLRNKSFDSLKSLIGLGKGKLSKKSPKKGKLNKKDKTNSDDEH